MGSIRPKMAWNFLAAGVEVRGPRKSSSIYLSRSVSLVIVHILPVKFFAMMYVHTESMSLSFSSFFVSTRISILFFVSDSFIKILWLFMPFLLYSLILLYIA